MLAAVRVDGVDGSVWTRQAALDHGVAVAGTASGTAATIASAAAARASASAHTCGPARAPGARVRHGTYQLALGIDARESFPDRSTIEITFTGRDTHRGRLRAALCRELCALRDVCVRASGRIRAALIAD